MNPQRPTPPPPIVSRMSIRGHPIHPMLIHFPVAALLMLLATDVAWVLTGDFFWARAGLWLADVGDPAGSIVPWGLQASALTAVLIAVAGFLGGRLVYEYAVGVDTAETADKHRQAQA